MAQTKRFQGTMKESFFLNATFGLMEESDGYFIVRPMYRLNILYTT